MKEGFLHYVWKFKKFDFLHAITSEGEEIQLLKVGQHNQDHAGPDFLDARMRIGGQIWAGNVEIHLKSSDWYAHRHEEDPAYDSVILHVVWEHDVEVFRPSNARIPTLVLKNITAPNAIYNYRRLLEYRDRRWINCAPSFHSFTKFDLENWLERLYIERLAYKSRLIGRILKRTGMDWEATLFCLLAKNFGLNLNGDIFLSMALSIPFKVIRKMQSDLQMEALLFGQAGMLKQNIKQPYYVDSQKEYDYLKGKFQLSRSEVEPVNYFRLRPPNFPTIRLSQLAMLFRAHQNLFSLIIKEKDRKVIQSIFKIETSPYWKTHYTFEKESKLRSKYLSEGFIDLLIINTLVPFKFYYSKLIGSTNYEDITALIRQLPPEKNSIVNGFNDLRPKTATNALESQALIQLKKEYCDKNRCLDCQLGIKLLGRFKEESL